MLFLLLTSRCRIENIAQMETFNSLIALDEALTTSLSHIFTSHCDMVYLGTCDWVFQKKKKITGGCIQLSKNVLLDARQLPSIEFWIVHPKPFIIQVIEKHAHL